jgi:serine/threonine protein kinase
LSSLSHPNIIKLHGITTQNEKILIIMEYCEMPDLFHLIHSKEKIKYTLHISGIVIDEQTDVSIPLDTYYTIFLDIARALKYLHTLHPPIVHSDTRY